MKEIRDIYATDSEEGIAQLKKEYLRTRSEFLARAQRDLGIDGLENKQESFAWLRRDKPRR
jgi:hypothetical protein